MVSFSNAIANESLANLTEFDAYDNCISNEGIKAFSFALSNGALASIGNGIIDLVLDHNKITATGKQQIYDVAKACGIIASAKLLTDWYSSSTMLLLHGSIPYPRGIVSSKVVQKTEPDPQTKPILN